MGIDSISKAYKAENLIGSYCTYPLRTYNVWFQNKIQANENTCERTAWKISYVVTGIFAHLTLGILALVGIAINLTLPKKDPKNVSHKPSKEVFDPLKKGL